MILILAGSDRFGEQRLLVVVVAIQRARGDSGRLGDVLQLDRMEAAVDEEPNGLLQNLLLSVLRAAPNGLSDGLPSTRTPFVRAGITNPARNIGYSFIPLCPSKSARSK